MACEVKGGVGYQGSLPWPKDEKDLARFKELTLNQTVLMGSGTWEGKGMPKPLPNRKNIVVSTRALDLPEGVELVDLNKDPLPDADWVIGGAALVESLWEHIDEFHLTRFRKAYEHDVNIEHLMQRLEQEFKQTRCQICLTHQYQIWKRKD